MPINAICVYCGSSTGTNPIYAEAARALGGSIAARGKTLVYGGAAVGLMGIVADAALAAGGRVLGIMPRALVDKEIQHAGLSELRVVDSMHTRKAAMIEAADALIALPGGFGTYEEIIEAATWAQLGYHNKPCGLLNINGFYDGLLLLIERAIADGFVKPAHRAIFAIAHEPLALLDAIEHHEMPRTTKWV
jgi:uncharacterized protein (TIGR00730 family)